jgi:hypothetical protein
MADVNAFVIEGAYKGARVGYIAGGIGVIISDSSYVLLNKNTVSKIVLLKNDESVYIAVLRFNDGKECTVLTYRKMFDDILAACGKKLQKKQTQQSKPEQGDTVIRNNKTNNYKTPITTKPKGHPVKRFLKFLFIALLIVIVIFLVLIIIGGLIDSDKDETNPTQKPIVTPQAITEEQKQPDSVTKNENMKSSEVIDEIDEKQELTSRMEIAALGTSKAVPHFDVIVNNCKMINRIVAYDMGVYEEYYAPDDGNTYISVNITFTNTANQEETIWASDFTLRSTDLTKEYERSSFLMTSTKENIFSGESINPGVRKTGNIIFEAPESLNLDELLLTYNDGSSTNYYFWIE